MKHIYFVKTLEIDGEEFDIMKFLGKLFIRTKSSNLKYKDVKSGHVLRTNVRFTKDFKSLDDDNFFEFSNKAIVDNNIVKQIKKFYRENIKEFDKAQYIIDKKFGQQMTNEMKTKRIHRK